MIKISWELCVVQIKIGALKLKNFCMGVYYRIRGIQVETGWRKCCVGDKCIVDCGHKGVHKMNTACLNMCSVTNEITCEMVKAPKEEKK